ncbi:MAG: T9SS type A sorting domain-containing protein [Candidatus Kapaibacteriota bacterium]
MKKIYLIIFFIPMLLKSTVPEIPEFDFEKIINYDIYSEKRTVWETSFYDLKSFYLVVSSMSIHLPIGDNFINSSYFIAPTLLGKDGSLIKITDTRRTATYFDSLADTSHWFPKILADENKIRIICERGYPGFMKYSFNSHPVIFDFNYNLELQKVKTDTTYFHPNQGLYLVIKDGHYFYGYNKLKFLKDSNGYILKRWGVYYIKEYKETDNYLEDMHKDIELKFPSDTVDTLLREIMNEFPFGIQKYPNEGQISAYFYFKDTTGKLYQRLCYFDKEGNYLYCNKEKLPPIFIQLSPGDPIFDKDGNVYTFNRNLDKSESTPPTLIKYDNKGNVIWETALPLDLKENDSLKVYIYRNNIEAEFLDSNHIIVFYSKYYYSSDKSKIHFPFFYIYDTDGNLLKAYEWDRTIEGNTRWWLIQDIHKEDDDHLFLIGRPTSNMAIDGRIIVSRIKFSTTDVKDNTKIKISKLEVYPNPAMDEININMKDKIYNYRITDILGKVIQTGKTQGKININDLITGQYSLEIIDNNKTYFSKFIKK